MRRNRRRSFSRPLVVALLLALAASPARTGAEPAPPSAAASMERWSTRLDAVEALDDTDESILNRAAKAGRVEREVRAARTDLAEQFAPEQQELDALGPPPDDAAPAEPANIARQRRRLESKAQGQEALLRRADAIIARAESMQSELHERERQRIRRHLLQRGPSPIAPTIWPRAFGDFGSLVEQCRATIGAWWVDGPPATRGSGPFIWPLVLGALALLAGRRLQVTLRRAFGRNPEIAAPDAGRRLIAATAESVAASAPLGLALLAALIALVELDLVTDGITMIATRVAGSALLLVLLPTLALTAFPTEATQWRLIPIDDERTGTVRGRLVMLAVFLAVTSFIPSAGRQSPEFEAAQAFVLTIPLAVLLLLLTPRRLWHPEPTDKTSAWDSLRFGANAAAITMLVAALGGWAHLAHEVARALIVSGLAVLGFTIVRTLVAALLALALAPESPHSAAVRDFLGIEERGTHVALFWLGLWSDAVLAVGVALVWMLAIGIPWASIAAWAASTAQGITIGSFHLSFADVLIAGVAFTAILGVSRFLRRTLTERVLPQTQLGAGAKHSLTTAVRYLGLLIAATVAVSFLGLDLSNIALVAGALSVGIGFGLQNVVNNFVSGIIMLVERPIKVGDWVVLGGNEGIVKRINVRSTEIETFQRSAVIIPNSEILASAIVNWTHRDHYGRLEVAVGVAYGSDVEKVRTILLDCAKNHDEITSLPGPYVLFRDFGASSLDFELRAYLRQNDRRLSVMSDLRFAIDAAFRRHGVEIPFAQHDLHLRDIDRLDEMLRGRAASSADARPPSDDDDAS